MWDFLEDKVWKTMQWDNPAEKSNTLISTNKDEVHSVNSSRATKSKITALIRRIETLKTPSTLQISQVN